MLNINNVKNNIPTKNHERKNLKMLNINDGLKFQEANKTWNYFIKYGHVDGNNMGERYQGNIKDVWSGEPCYIVGCGPALKEFLELVGWDFLRGKHTIGINHIIEDFDEFEWFFFLDKRFIEKTTYDLNNFKGRIFAQSNTGMKQSENVTLFHCNHMHPQTDFDKGLFSPNFSGLAALNLAILTGANPIYLIGYGMGARATKDNYHYKPDYTGEVKTEKVFEKFKKVQQYYEQFEPWKDRIVHVTQGVDMPMFKKMDVLTFKRKNKLVIKTMVPKVVHYSFSDKIEVHADITRALIEKGYGQHEIHNIKDPQIKAADVYIMEHFISTHQAVMEFPYKQKAIDIVHSQSCLPVGSWGKVVALTDAWKTLLEKHLVQNVVTVKGGIDLEQYTETEPDYSKQVFGRITRWSAGKIHPEWNRIVKQILDESDRFICRIYTQMDYANQRAPLQHDRMIYDKSAQIHHFKGQYLKNLSIYVHANGSFKDTMSHAVIEAMATGLPIVYLTEKTGVIEEVTGSAGIRCETIDQVKDKILMLLKDEQARREYGRKSKEQAKLWSIENWVNGMNEIIKGMLK